MDIKEAALQSEQRVSRHPWELARLEVIRSILEESVPVLSTPGTGILDLGCGDGFVVGALARVYPRLQFIAVDSALSRWAIDSLQERTGLANLKFYQDLGQAKRGAQVVHQS